MPSLNALRAFEAAARHESFAKAAVELNVTAAAIAQQVRALEDWAGCCLFQRLPHGLRLTKEAKAALPRMADAFDRLGLAVQALRAANRPDQVRIAALPAIAILWLSPRLQRLRQRFPDIEMSVTALEEPPNFRRDLYDLALFFVDTVDAGTEAITLSHDSLYPVCSPKFLTDKSAPTTPSGLDSAKLLHDSVWRDDWPQWLRFAGVTGVDPNQGATFSLYYLALQATLDGSGILIGHEVLIADAINDGRLIAPFDLKMPGTAPLTLLVSQEIELHSTLVDLIAWFKTETMETP